MNDINQRQQSIYDYILDFKNRYQYSPSVREIGQALNIKSTSTVYSDLNKLEEVGLIRRLDNKSRSIELTSSDSGNYIDRDKEDTIDVPILGRVAAGEPIFAEENIEYFFPIPSYYSTKGDLFMLRVKGESMIEAGILDGDKILVRKQDTCDNGDIVVALIDDGATVKTFQRVKGQVQLIPQNSTMSPIIPDNCQILGKVIALYRDNFN